MMKKLFKQKMKKALSLVCTLTMLIGMLGVPVQAATGHTLTINSETNGHTYQAYQVFAGDYSETAESTKVLSNITWGSGVDGNALLTALKADTAYGTKFTNCNTAADVAKAIDGLKGDANFPTAFAAIVAKHLNGTPTSSGTPSGSTGSYTYNITGLGDGYYFINEKSFTDNPADNAYTKYMLQVLDDVSVAAKTDKPSIALKVLENNDSTYKNSWNDAADYSIGSDVPYRIVSLVPDMTNFSTYNYKITDTISTGSTFKADSVKVYFVNTGEMYGVETSTATGAGGTLIDSSQYKLTPASNASGFTVEFTDLKSTTGVSNNGYIVVEYTAQLDKDAAINSNTNKVGNPTEVLLTYSNNPNDPAGMGQTPKDEVDVYTFALPVSKTDAANKALAGATFAVFASKTEAQAAASDPTKLTNALVFTGSAGVYTLGGTTNALTGDTTGNYAVKGLDQGTYYLVETAAPNGYNRLLEPVTVTVAPTYNTGDRTSAYVDGHVPDATSDQLTAVKINDATGLQVVNQTGTTLPETGGMGTRIFMGVGLTLMIAAAVLIVIRKKNIPAK
ncbi:SpaH/EbpB family LPXTG-anchored major pilin [Acetobacterium paludosum]|uniref:SpaH/EbpB family LPXTG-anchored major pilin n=1 Tax=Acetobacterium paludosum TaxID=52693 RepID=A0A923HY57_9FIRM|nr:SpaH/EbpB family LPXTG-anchored major pilin [Acetobacterium paludosum]MBC3886753.1 SpaH/EbpB family LPXTG-anchored major pilin [Acetobacterium paludosum]